MFTETAPFIDPHTLAVGDGDVTTPTGWCSPPAAGRSSPTCRGWTTVPHHTSDTVMRLPELPRSMLIVGGGYIAAEFAHVFSSYGTRVTVVNRGERLLRREDGEVSARFTELARHRVDVRPDPDRRCAGSRRRGRRR